MKKIIFLLIILSSSFIFAQDGSLDLTFDVKDGVNEYSFVKTQPDGKILLVQNFQYNNGNPIYTTISRLNDNGSLDEDFNISTITDGGYIASLAIQPDGKIIIVGDFQSLNDTPMNCLARLDEKGFLDPSFDSDTQIDFPNGYLLSVALQKDNKILVGGRFDSYKGVPREGLTRLEENGSLDLSFTTGVTIPYTNTFIDHLIVQDDGKILVGGESYFSEHGKIITRLNSDGSEDNSFTEPFLDMACGFGCPFYSMLLQQNDKIIIGGEFNVYASGNLNVLLGSNIARLNSNGTTESCFYTDLNPYDGLGIYPSSLQQDEKIIVRGNYPNYDGSQINQLARLNTNGSLDSDFNIGSGPNGEVYRTEIQPDGKLIIIGSFTEYDGVARNHIARLNGRSLSISDFEKKEITVYPNPVKDFLHVSLPATKSAITYEISDLIAKKVLYAEFKNNEINIDVSALNTGIYFLKIKSENEVFLRKFIKD